MAEPGGRDASLLLDMMLAAQDAIAFVTGLDETAFLHSRLHQNAVIRSLEIIGEAAGKVSAELKAAHPEIPCILWKEGKGTAAPNEAMIVKLEFGYRHGPLASAGDGIVCP